MAKAKATPLTLENFPSALNNVKGKFYNGSDIPSDKGLIEGLEYVSKSVYLQGKKIDALDSKLATNIEETKINTAETNENSLLLKSERNKKIAVENILVVLKNLSWWQKTMIVVIVVHYIGLFIESSSGAKVWDSIYNLFAKLF